MNLKLILVVLFSFLIFTVNFGTEPVPPPYYKYFITGTLHCDSLISRKNFTIQVYGKSNQYQPEFMAVTALNLDYEIPVALTDSAGYYYLIVNSHYFYDSIKVALIKPQQDPVFSEVYNLSITQGNPITAFYTYDSGGCNSCSSDPSSSSRTIRYEFNLSTSLRYCE